MGGARIWWIALVTALLPTAAEGRGRYLRVSSENEATSILCVYVWYVVVAASLVVAQVLRVEISWLFLSSS